MLNSKLSRISAFAVLAIVCAAAASEAEAAKNRPARQRMGGVVIMNPTSNALSFQMRLGYEDAWTDYVVEAGQELQVFFDLDRDGTVPAPNIRFDRVAGDSRLTYQDYELSFYEIEREDDMTGFRYEFQYGASGKTIDLFRIDGQ